MTMMQLDNLRNDFRHITTELKFFASYHQTLRMLNAIENNNDEYRELTNDFALFSMGSRLYDQIRILNTSGMETLRVNFNKGNPDIVQKDQLQYKGDRYYFKETVDLHKGEIFISPFDLNIEQNEIEKPLKPMIRFSTPIFDDDEKKGIIIFNYLGENLIKTFKDVVIHSPGHYMLLNSDGYWIVGRDIEDEWGFMYEDKKNITMRAADPDVWNKIHTSDSGQFYHAGGLYTFKTIYPIIESLKFGTASGEEISAFSQKASTKNYFWKIVSHIPASTFIESERTSRKKYIFIDIIILIPLGLITVFLSHTLEKRKQAQEKIFKQNIKLIELNELKNKFLGIAAHDLRNPITSIRGFSEILIDGELGEIPEDQKEFICIINTVSDEMLILLNDLLDLSVIESGKLEIERVNGSLKDLIAERVRINKVIADNKDIAIHAEYMEIPDIMFDPKRIAQVFDNLVSNAIKFSPSGANIYISMSISVYEVSVHVKDEGPGISDEDQSRLFGEFQKLSAQPTGGEKSSGLGLSIVKKIVKAHGGKISVASNLEKGATFSFALPREKCDDRE